MPAHIDANFAARLAPHFRLEELDRYPASVFGLGPDSRLAYFNPAWTAFADANGGQPRVASTWGLGTRYLDAIAEPLRPFYERLLAGAPEPGASLHPVSHQYECSSATLLRRFNMQVYSLPGGAGVVVVNSLLVEMTHDASVRPPQSADRGRYLDPRGIIVQCSHCRLVQRAADPTRWDWVPAWVEHSPSETSHSVCHLCFEYYYPDDAS